MGILSTLRSPSLKMYTLCYRSINTSTSVRLNVLQTKKWFTQPFQVNSLKNTLKLFGLTLSAGVAFHRQGNCYTKKVITKEANTKRNLNSEYNATFHDLWIILKPVFHYFIAAVMCVICTAYINITIPLLLGKLINEVTEILKSQNIGTINQLHPLGIKLVGFYLLQSIFTFAYIFFISVMGEGMAINLRKKLFNHLIKHDMTFFDKQRIGEICDRLNFDVQEFKSSFKMAVTQGLKAFTQTGGSVISLYFLSPKMTLFTIGIIPIIILIGTGCSAFLRELSKRSQAQNGKISSVASEAFGNIRTVKAFAMEDITIDNYTKELENYQLLNIKLGGGIGLFQCGTNLFLNGIVLGVLWSGSQMVIKNEMLAGELMSFLITAQSIQKSLSQISVVSGNAVRGWSALSRIFEYLNINHSLISGNKKIPHHSLFGSIKFEDVSFSYETRNNHLVLDEISLDIPHGKVTALCGSSGGGKSTIASLIERFYDPTSGKITLDGYNLKDLDSNWLRKFVVGYISQEPILFHGTIEENIRYGKPNATNEEIYNAAKLANADKFILSFPDKYNTMVGERGVTLSGGQKQRIAIARAILKNPPILILDEATSALDSESERLVSEALNNATKNRTVLVIAHRISTIKDADNIIVIKDKKVIEQGTHEQLMRKKGNYYQLVKAQDLS
ncbi:ATP-binding cassette sub-family B member 8, mitochondrial [Strongyloides ratti]|uniref:Mitochondrial potassium channel ATP-binding subunit n=1 Tax=Strongyloides ratti TaxID=34506 RepID=A0A090LNC0_STRRB|nr:ATP-binding cassette sub-family B member 8, mitochondrial [Strongyloides ratti]CEF71360.1 ATP-binding cassette sub-family B member 8, mitochondrial [Strongyloides ratti]